nr:olfactory receptor 52A5-like [Cavia porcellus]
MGQFPEEETGMNTDRARDRETRQVDKVRSRHIYPKFGGIVLRGPVTSFANGTCFNPSIFALIGIPGLETVQHWLRIPFFISFLLATIGNGLLITIIHSEHRLHEPMYVFLAILAVHRVWRSPGHAFDQNVAICEPLRHSAILTRKVLISIIIAVTVRASVIIIMCPFLNKQHLKHFQTTLLAHFYCKHRAVVKLAAEHIRANKACGHFVAFSVLGFDSYTFIFHAVFKLPQEEVCFKTLNTGTGHIFLQFYILTFFTSFIHRFGFNVAPYVHILMSKLYLLVPPLLNPIIYGVKTKQIREGVSKVFIHKG